jgi:adenylate cyclase
VRIFGEAAFITIKGGKQGISRPEYEYPIPRADAEELLETLCRRPLIEKTRHTLHYGGLEWVVDVFAGDNAGLVLAEVELDSADQSVELPPWAGREVTHDPRYLNVNLARHPYSLWERCK